MINYCLSRNQIGEFASIDFAHFELTKVSGEVDYLFDNARRWETQLICLTYLLAHVIEAELKRGWSVDQATKLVQRLYELQDSIWLTMQEMDSEFIRFMFRHVRYKEQTLEECLMEIQSKLSNRDYA